VATATLHEDLKREDRTEGPSDRNFGLTTGIMLALTAVWKSYSGSAWGLVCGGLGVARVFDVRGGQCIEHLGKFLVVAAVKRIPELRISLFRLLRQVHAGRLAGS